MKLRLRSIVEVLVKISSTVYTIKWMPLNIAREIDLEEHNNFIIVFSIYRSSTVVLAQHILVKLILKI
jgi:hypothetical protein